MEDFPRILCLAKVGREDHLRSIRAGKIFAHSLDFYRDAQFTDKHFFDCNEGLIALLDSANARIHIKHPTLGDIELSSDNGLTGQVRVAMNNTAAFCLHSIRVAPDWQREISEDELEAFENHLRIPEKLKRFGESILFFTDFKEFLRRAYDAGRANGLQVRHGSVEYRDLNNFRGRIASNEAGFIKDLRYAHEREFRILFTSASQIPAPLTLELGSLEEFTMILPWDEAQKSFKVGFEESDRRIDAGLESERLP